MTVRAVEGQKLWTGGTAITVDQLNKVISLNIRDENNLIEYDVGDDEIYVDLQLGDEIRPTSDFPVGVTVGRAITDNGWGMTGTILVAKTTSGDNIKLFYCDDGKLYIDNGTGTFKQIYLKSEVDALLLELRQYVDQQLALKQDKEGVMMVNRDNESSCRYLNEEYCTMPNSLDGVVVYYQGGNQSPLGPVYNMDKTEIYYTVTLTLPSSATTEFECTGMYKIINNEIVFFPWEGAIYSSGGNDDNR